MKLIDEKLGGTTPLEVILKFGNIEEKTQSLQKKMNLKIGMMMKER